MFRAVDRGCGGVHVGGCVGGSPRKAEFASMIAAVSGVMGLGGRSVGHREVPSEWYYRKPIRKDLI